jgi:PAS domain S-box-containing protein
MGISLVQERIAPCSHADEGPREQRGEAGDLYLRAMLDACASGAALLNEAGDVLYANEAWHRLAVRNGMAHALCRGRLDYIEICEQVSGASADQASAMINGLRRILQGRETEFQKEYVVHRSSDFRIALIRAVRLDVPGPARVLVTHEDGVNRRREAGSENEEWLHLLLRMAHILPWEADAESGRFIDVGEQAVGMLGYPTERWYEPDFFVSHIHPDDRERAVADCLRYSKTRDNYESEYRMIAGDGRVVWLRHMAGVTRRDGLPATACGFLIDVTEHKRAEDALMSLSGRLINVQEAERKRIARELHDDLNQRMALISIELTQLGQRLQKPRGLGLLVRSLQARVQEVSAEIHRLSYRLHPSKLDHLGLGAAVESLCEELTASLKLKVEFRQRGFPAALPKDISLCVFRIAQEALRNCVRHSGAPKALVVLERGGSVLRLSVSDEGRGFDTESDAMKKGLGFTSMRERLRLVGGEMWVRSQPSCGTRVEISVPLRGKPGPLDESPHNMMMKSRGALGDEPEEL